MLEVNNLFAEVEDKQVLKGLSLKVKAGETHAIMGPNGSGKSSLSKIIAGHPAYKVTAGELKYEVNFEMRNLLAMEPDERAKEGIFLAFQYPVEVPGVSNLSFLHAAYNSVCKHHGIEEMSVDGFERLVAEKSKLVDLNPSFLQRPVNQGFSGGEKKRNEILQMAILNPRLSFLDETDSGLDIDSLKVVASGVNKLKKKDNAVVLITHYQRLLDYIKPDFVHVLYNGRIIETGDSSLARQLESKGYDWLIQREQGA
jgi:Fe-S cluster assembly ATP-binding protein